MCFSPPNLIVPSMSDKEKRNGGNGKKNKLPEGFPGTVKVFPHRDRDPCVTLHEKYRRYEYGRGDEDFLWFVENVLSAQNACKTKFAQRKSTMTVSEIFTPQDEAFGLVVLLNEVHCWKEDWINQKNKIEGIVSDRTNQAQKLYIKRKSGSKDPWDEFGIMVYKQLIVEVKKRREEEESKKWEAAYKYSNGPKTHEDIDKNQTYNKNRNEKLSSSERMLNYIDVDADDIDALFTPAPQPKKEKVGGPYFDVDGQTADV